MHNPEKNKALCIIAKTSYWTLSVLGWVFFGLLVIGFIVMLGVEIYENWPLLTPVFINALMVVGALLLFMAVFGGSLYGLITLHGWAKNYRRDC